MKRQSRNVDHDGKNLRAVKAEGKSATKTPTIRRTTKGKQKGKDVVAVEKVVEEERKGSGGESSVEVVMENLVGGGWGDQWPWSSGTVDEQMSWGSIWFPFWDVDYMGEACAEMFSDVVWDDDLWNMKGIDHKITEEQRHA